MPTYIRGRRRSLDQPKKAQICDLVARGASVEEAAEDVGVSLRTVQREAKGDEDFHHELRLAQRTKPDPLKIMESAARTHWRAAAWLLERTDPERYARRPARSASPQQVYAALTQVLEAALQKTSPEQRDAVYQHVQSACDEAYRAVFPDIGLWGRRQAPQTPPTPLVAEASAKRARNVPPSRQVYDRCAAAPEKPSACTTTTTPRTCDAPSEAPCSNGVEPQAPVTPDSPPTAAKAAPDAKPKLRVVAPDPRLSWRYELRAAASRSAVVSPETPDASKPDDNPLLSPKTHIATESPLNDNK